MLTRLMTPNPMVNSRVATRPESTRGPTERSGTSSPSTSPATAQTSWDRSRRTARAGRWNGAPR